MCLFFHLGRLRKQTCNRKSFFEVRRFYRQGAFLQKGERGIALGTLIRFSTREIELNCSTVIQSTRRITKLPTPLQNPPKSFNHSEKPWIFYALNFFQGFSITGRSLKSLPHLHFSEISQFKWERLRKNWKDVKGLSFSCWGGWFWWEGEIKKSAGKFGGCKGGRGLEILAGRRIWRKLREGVKGFRQRAGIFENRVVYIKKKPSLKRWPFRGAGFLRNCGTGGLRKRKQWRLLGLF